MPIIKANTKLTIRVAEILMFLIFYCFKITVYIYRVLSIVGATNKVPRNVSLQSWAVSHVETV